MTYNFSNKNDVITISNKPSLKGRIIGFSLVFLSLIWLAYILYQFWIPVFDSKNAGIAFYPVLIIALTVFFTFNYKTIHFDLKSDSIIIIRQLIRSKTIYLKMGEVIGIKSVRNDYSYGGNYRNREHISPNHSFTSYLVLNSERQIKLFQIHGRFWKKYFDYLKILREETGICLLDG